VRAFTRLFLVIGTLIATVALPCLVASASAGSQHARPTITSTKASFTIPSGSSQAWMIRLWTLPQPSTLVGHTIGQSGTVSVAVPQTSNCQFQADVLVGPSGATKPSQFKWYSGLTKTVSGCGSAHCPPASIITSGGGSRTPPTITNLVAEFKIPTGSKHAWMLRLWTLPTPSTLEGQVIGSAGTLKISVPRTATCTFQVDVKVAPADTTRPKDFVWYSGVTAKV
jgi:hypothetical protein